MFLAALFHRQGWGAGWGRLPSIGRADPEKPPGAGLTQSQPGTTNSGSVGSGPWPQSPTLRSPPLLAPQHKPEAATNHESHGSLISIPLARRKCLGWEVRNLGPFLALSPTYFLPLGSHLLICERGELLPLPALRGKQGSLLKPGC